MGMKWRDPMPTNCPACGGKFPISVAALRSLRAACPGCGASLAAAGERMLAEEDRVHREAGRLIGLLSVGLKALTQPIRLSCRVRGC